MYDVTYIKIQFNHSKLRKFISLQKMGKNTIKLHGFFLHKTNKKCKESQGRNVLCIRGYEVT